MATAGIQKELPKHARLMPLLTMVAILIVLPTAAQILYSGLGFNPTDDGLMLAGSRRILSGQIPHLDFISVRPVGSFFIHIPFVLFGGELTIWLSRYFVWFQYSAISVSWVLLSSRLLRVTMSGIRLVASTVFVFVLGSFVFPIMVWHSVDALFFASIGTLVIVSSSSERMRMLGYVLIGFSVLCRLNFILYLPVALLLSGGWRRPWQVIALLSPGLLYAAIVVLSGGWKDAATQLRPHAAISTLGVHNYVRLELLWGIGTGWAAAVLGSQHTDGVAQRLVPRVWRNALTGGLLFVILGLVAATIYSNEYYYRGAIGLFGCVLGFGAARIAEGGDNRGPAILAILAAALAWSVSLSIGIPSPALGGAAMGAVIVVFAIGRLDVIWPGAIARYAPVALVCALAVSTFAIQHQSRMRSIYRERPASELTYSVGDVLRGGRLLKTNVDTYAFLADLQVAVSRVEGQRYAVYPDLAAYWVKADQTNPLLIDWPQSTELAVPELVDRLRRQLQEERGSLAIIMQKVSAAQLKDGILPLEGAQRFPATEFIRTNYTKVDETQYFAIYK